MFHRTEFGVRHCQTLLAFLAFTVAYIARTDLSVAIVAMTSKERSNNEQSFSWDEATKSNILTAFQVGYIIGQLPGGMIAERYGAKYVIGFAMIVIGLTKAFAPICTTNWDYIAMASLRFFEGIVQAAFFPGLTTYLSKWIPPQERYTLRSPAYGGVILGCMLGYLVSGLIAGNFGWSYTFYTTAVICFVWTILWFLCSANSPSVHKTISDEERLYIEEGLGKSVKSNTKGISTPWSSILKSGPFYALLFAHIGRNWGYFTIIIQTPRYIAGVLKADIKKNALISSLPYALGVVMVVVYSQLGLYVQDNTNISLTVQRKFWNTIALWGPALSLVVIVLCNSRDDIFVTAIFCLAMATNTAVYNGFMGNHVDLSPNFSGTLMSVTNFFGAISAALAPMAVGYIVHDQSNASEWHLVFMICVAFMFFGNTFYMLFGSAQLQPWNNPKSLMTGDIAMNTNNGGSDSAG